MPRVSEAEKQKSHDRIVAAASRLLRESGAETASVADIMDAAGMTHGGFYRHFGSKEEMVAEAFGHAVSSVVAEMEAAPPGPDRDKAKDAYIATYLSPRHVRSRGEGCPLAALAVELSRNEGPPRDAAENAVGRMAGLLSSGDAEDSAQGFATMALMLGTVVLARLATDQDDADWQLEAGKIGVQALRQNWPQADA